MVYKQSGKIHKKLQVTIENQYVAPNTPYDFKGQQGANDDYTSVAFYYMEGAQFVDLMSFEEEIKSLRQLFIKIKKHD